MRFGCLASIRRDPGRGTGNSAIHLRMFVDVGIAVSRLTFVAEVETLLTFAGVQEGGFLRRARKVGIRLILCGCEQIVVEGSFGLVADVFGSRAFRGSHRLVEHNLLTAARLKHQVEVGRLAHCSPIPTG